MKKIFVTFLALTLCLCTLAGCSAGKIKVDMEDYISVSYTGYNGNGTAVFDFDYVNFEYEIMSQWKDDDKSFTKLAELTALETTINCDPATIEGLSNGDKITVTMTYDKEKAKELGYSFTGTSKTFTVEGLNDAIMIDPFDESVFGKGKIVDAGFDGIAPKVWYGIYNQAPRDYKYINDPISGVTYEVDKYENLKNGDVVTVTATLSDEWINKGYALSRTEITVTVEGHDTYVTDPSMLTNDFLQGLADITYNRCVADDVIDLLDGTNNGWYLGAKFKDIHIGKTAYLMVGKDQEDVQILIPVYKTFVWEGKVWKDTVSFYTFRNIILSADGNLSYNTDNVDGNAFFTNMDLAQENVFVYYREYFDIIEFSMP